MVQLAADGEIKGSDLLAGVDETTEVEIAKRIAERKLKDMWRCELQLHWEVSAPRGVVL